MRMPSSEALPNYPGPKLDPFPFPEATRRDITFLEYLGRGLHAHVFRVNIEGSIFALKLFRFIHPSYLIHPNVVRDGTASLEDGLNLNDPFHSECRAYGRLKEEGREDLAVGCYGYLHLSQEQEDHLAERGCDDWDRYDAVKDDPVRGIVKEYVADDGTGPFTYDMMPRMRRDIEDLNRLGIIVWDVRTDNYRAGRLVDFSQAHTAPHLELDWNSPAYSTSQVMDCCVRDRVCFDEMIDDWNEANPDRIYWRRFMPNPAYGDRLRKPKPFHLAFYKNEGARFLAADYDWEKKDAAAQTSKTSRNPRAARRTRNSRVAKRGVVQKPTSSGASRKKARKPH